MIKVLWRIEGLNIRVCRLLEDIDDLQGELSDYLLTTKMSTDFYM